MIRINKFIPLISFFLLLLIILSFTRILPERIVAFDFLKVPLSFFVYPGQVVKEIIFSYNTKWENGRLKRENSILNFEVARLKETLNENSRLRELLALKSSGRFLVVAANLIARDPDNWASTIIIDKGRQSKVKEDCIVIGKSGLVGIVTEAGLTTSRAMLVNDPNFHCAAIIERSRAQGLLSGSLFGGCRLHFFSREDDVVVGDMVLASGLTIESSQSLFPKGVIIGEVKYVAEESSGLGKYCLVEPVEKLVRLEEILVIIP